MQALRRKNPLTESFLVQLDLDLESAGLQGIQSTSYPPPSAKVSAPEQLQNLSNTIGNATRSAPAAAHAAYHPK